MIKIELEFATGAEARQALTDLLGGNINPTVRFQDLPIKEEKIAENFEAPKTEAVAEETQPKKRRTKAEIEADKAPATPEKDNAAQESLKDDIQAETPAKEEPKAITKEMLQEKAVNLIRNGKKEQVTTTIKSFGADSISQADKNPVKAESYGALMDAFNAIV